MYTEKKRLLNESIKLFEKSYHKLSSEMLCEYATALEMAGRYRESISILKEIIKEKPHIKDIARRNYPKFMKIQMIGRSSVNY